MVPMLSNMSQVTLSTTVSLNKLYKVVSRIEKINCILRLPVIALEQVNDCNLKVGQLDRMTHLYEDLINTTSGSNKDIAGQILKDIKMSIQDAYFVIYNLRIHYQKACSSLDCITEQGWYKQLSVGNQLNHDIPPELIFEICNIIPFHHRIELRLVSQAWKKLVDATHLTGIIVVPHFYKQEGLIINMSRVRKIFTVGEIILVLSDLRKKCNKFHENSVKYLAAEMNTYFEKYSSPENRGNQSTQHGLSKFKNCTIS